MRPALLIIAANLLAFALGVVITLWLTRIVSPALPLNAPIVAAPRPNPAARLANGSGAAAAAIAPASGAPPSLAAPTAATSNAFPPSAVTGGSDAAPPAASLPVEAAAAVPAAPAAAAAGPSPPSAYVLQLAAFGEPAKATQMQAELLKQGFAASVVPSKGSGKTWQLVQLGSFADRSSAAAAAVSLRRDTGLAALVMKPAPQ